MTAKAALVRILLNGEVTSIKTCFRDTGLSCCSREISRMIEKDFNVIVSRTHKVGKSRFGTPISWTEYRLNKTDYNKEGIKKMREYLKQKQNERKN